jgi:hypothetical protein
LNVSAHLPEVRGGGAFVGADGTGAWPFDDPFVLRVRDVK